MPNFLIDLLKKSKFKKPINNDLGYYIRMKHGARVPASSVITQSSSNSTILPGSTVEPSQNTTTTTTSTTTTTTTQVTTTTSTTTTTTTLPAGVYAFEMKYSALSSTDACNQVSSTIYYSNSATLSLFTALCTDPELTINADAGYYCLASGCPNDSGRAWVRSGGAAIIQAANC